MKLFIGILLIVAVVFLGLYVGGLYYCWKYWGIVCLAWIVAGNLNGCLIFKKKHNLTF